MSLYPRLDDLLELRHHAHTLGLPSRHLVNSTFSGLYASVFRGAGINFEEVREYREGDDIRYMDWKVTARTNDPHLKIFREERERSVVLCVDRGPHMSFGTRGTFKSVQAARAAALIGWAASQLNDRVGGMAFGCPVSGLQHFRPSRGRRALWQLLRTLTEPSITANKSIDCLSEALKRAASGLPTGSLIFVIADLNRDAMSLERTIGDLMQRHSVALIPVDDPADWNIPDMGITTFTATDNELIEVDTADAAARQVYQETWEKRRDMLQAIAHRLHIILLPVRTDQEIHLSLIRGLEQRARSRAV
jgi:uncharacterized protein (DUF58 family)